MPDIDIPLFHSGVDQELENVRDFINKMKRAFMSQDYDDAHKVQYFGFSLKDGCPASECFAGLTVAKSRAEKQEELAEAHIREDELGQKVKVNRVEMYTHVAWADKVERLAKAVLDDNNLLICTTRDNMAPSLRALVPYFNDTWTTFCSAVRSVSIVELREKKSERAAMEKLKEDVHTLSTRVPQMPSKALVATLERFKLSTPIPAPNFNPVRNPAPQPAAATTGPKTGRTDAEKWPIILKLPAPTPATKASRAAHAVLVAQWISTNMGMTSTTEDRPFPLTPSTMPLGSGECAGCGQMGHYETICTAATKLHPIESRWRRKVNSIRKGATAPAAVNFVGEAPMPVLSEDQLDTLERFLAEQRGQGNGEGSSD
ncbi:hypothetical protein H0H92_006741 [Tricholoma furcatifolium]|nr:hypothetical protein H0H92_006741 [Tricholoma furcatifolium]